MNKAPRKLPVSPNSIKHHILWEVSVRDITTSELVQKVKQLTTVESYYVSNTLLTLLQDGLINASTAIRNHAKHSDVAVKEATWKITDAGSRLVNDVGRPHYTKRQRATKESLAKAQKTGVTNEAVSRLPNLRTNYLEYASLSLRPGSLDYRSIPSLR